MRLSRKALPILFTLVASLMLVMATTARADTTLRINLRGDPAMLDPITYSELMAGDVMKSVYEAFTNIDKDGNVIPGLATSWESHEDGLGWRFHLRKGVKFHSGRDFTAKDVKWTMEQLLIPGNKGGLNTRYLKNISGAQAVKDGATTNLVGVEIVDDHTVDIRLDNPDVLFPIYPTWFMDSGIIEEHGQDWVTKVSAGTGPFSFVEWNRGQNILLSANKDFWGDGPHIDGVNMLIVPNDDTTISMYEAGELDVIYVRAVTGRRLLKDSRFENELNLVPAAQIQYLGLNQTQYAPFKDIRVREAVCISIDRDAMVAGLYGGAAFPLYGQVTPGVAGYNPNLESIPYDLDRAKKLMAEAGYPNGEGLPPLKVTSTNPRKDEISYYANQLNSSLGMPIEVEVVERGSHIKNMNTGQVAFFPWGWTAGYPDAMYFLSQVWYGPSKYNRSRWQNDRFDALLDQSKTVPDNNARYKLYNEAEQVLLNDWGTCPTTVRMQISAVKPNVTGVVLSPFRFLPFNSVKIN